MLTCRYRLCYYWVEVIKVKSKEVLEILKITRPTLTKYVKEEMIHVTEMPNKRYNYNDEDVYKIFNKEIIRRTVVYARVSSQKQKKDLANQIELLKQFCFSNGFQVNNVFSDIASGITFENRNDFFKMLDLILSRQVEKVVISYEDRLSRVGFGLFQYLFKKFGCEIVVMSEVGNKRLDSEEIFEEIISLLHCYSMKLYSKRKHKKIKEIVGTEE